MVYYVFIVSKLQCITHAIMIKSKVLRTQARMTLSDILFRHIGLFLLPNTYIFWLSNISTLSVPDEGYYRNAPCALHLISTFSLCVYIDYI